MDRQCNGKTNNRGGTDNTMPKQLNRGGTNNTIVKQIIEEGQTIQWPNN
jgi:hypothetical protein